MKGEKSSHLHANFCLLTPILMPNGIITDVSQKSMKGLNLAFPVSDFPGRRNVCSGCSIVSQAVRAVHPSSCDPGVSSP